MAIDFKVHTYASLPSTQHYVKELVAEGLPEGTVVQAIEQRAGKGRHGRKWFSPMGNLYMSVLLRPDCDVAQAGQLAFVAAVAVAAAIDTVLDEKHKLSLKWPNDILIDGKKVCGILIEKEADGYALGIGVNIMAPPDGAVALNDVTWDIQVPVHPFRDKLLAALGETYSLWQDEGFAKIRSAWLAQAHGVDEPIKTEKGEGIFRGLSEDGALQLETAEGAILDINSGDVYFAAEDKE